MLRFIQSFFRKTPRPPAGCTKIQGAELQVGMEVSLHDRPWLNYVSGRIYLLSYHGRRWKNLLGDAGAVSLSVFVETPYGDDIGCFRIYWNEYLWIYDD